MKSFKIIVAFTIIASLIFPKQAIHVVMHVPGIIVHIIHHHEEYNHKNEPVSNSHNHNQENHNHDDLPFNHDHSADGQTVQSMVLFYQEPEIPITMPVEDNTLLIVFHFLSTSEFVKKVWLPPKIV